MAAEIIMKDHLGNFREKLSNRIKPFARKSPAILKIPQRFFNLKNYQHLNLGKLWLGNYPHLQSN
jgi:hypothetical protein